MKKKKKLKKWKMELKNTKSEDGKRCCTGCACLWCKDDWHMKCGNCETCSMQNHWRSECFFDKK